MCIRPMRIRWTVPAADDLQNIKNYLQQHYPHFAEPTVRVIYQRIRLLKTSPNRGRARPPERHQRTGADATPLRRGLFRESRSCRNPAYLSRCAGLAMIFDGCPRSRAFRGLGRLTGGTEGSVLCPSLSSLTCAPHESMFITCRR